jgi:type II restriction enzyme
MMEAIREDRAPSYFFLHYDFATWSVRNLLLVPSFAFPPSAIIQCPPLSPTARRAGWLGCNFDLHRIPAEARIWLVTTIRQSRAGVSPAQRARQREQSAGFADAGRRDACPTLIATPEEVRAQFKKVKPLKDIKQRGWTLDVLNLVRKLGKTEFTNSDAYTFARELEKLHPDNRHVRDKIRQQLQVLRDAKLLIHVSSGVWKLP